MIETLYKNKWPFSIAMYVDWRGDTWCSNIYYPLHGHRWMAKEMLRRYKASPPPRGTRPAYIVNVRWK